MVPRVDPMVLMGPMDLMGVELTALMVLMRVELMALMVLKMGQIKMVLLRAEMIVLMPLMRVELMVLMDKLKMVVMKLALRVELVVLGVKIMALRVDPMVLMVLMMVELMVLMVLGNKALKKMEAIQTMKEGIPMEAKGIMEMEILKQLKSLETMMRWKTCLKRLLVLVMRIHQNTTMEQTTKRHVFSLLKSIAIG